MAEKNEGGANERLRCSKQGNQNREASHNMAAGKQTKRKYDQNDYEQPECRAARNSVRELNDGMEGRSSGKPNSIAKRPLISTAGARAGRSDSGAPQDDRNRKSQNKPGICGEALLGRHVVLNRILVTWWDRRIIIRSRHRVSIKGRSVRISTAQARRLCSFFCNLRPDDRGATCAS
jgi:hypothetical protein